MLAVSKNRISISSFIFLLFFALQSHATAFVHLFEWQWNAVASECENYLGPKGYQAVQVSPPQKSVSGNQWWTRYQPVSYAIEGRSGSRQEFANMVQRCNAAGVDVYVDTVINHMAAWDRSFPEVPYGPNDFHNCTTGIDYNNAWEVQNCDLVGLNDLATESDYVRGKIADYMNDLISLGVDGFRIDAAKHIAAADIANIVNRLNGNPYIFQEVIYNGSEAVTPAQYTSIGDVTEFNFTNTIGTYFKGRGALAELRNIGSWSGWLPSDTAVTFVANHDNQRQNTSNIITHKDGNNLNNLAHIFMLAWPYGYPKVMSSYDWQNHDQGPPSQPANNCSNGWLCEHRNRPIANMVGFRNATQSAFHYDNWWDNGGNQIAFSRGDRGFVIINSETSNLTINLYTGLASGEYCDVINSDFNNGSCDGTQITVDNNGYANFTVPARNARAIHVNAFIGGNGGGNGSDECNNDSMYLRGTFNSWQSLAMDCNNGEWVATQLLNASAQFKFDAFANWQTNWGDNNNDRIAEQNASNIVVTSSGTYEIRFNDNTLQYSVELAPTPTPTPTPTAPPPPQTVNVNFSCLNGTTYMGQEVFVVGSVAELGNWSPTSAVQLSPTQYPAWTGTITLPNNAQVQWKCIKREGGSSQAGLVWQSGSNNVVNTETTTTAQASF